MAEQVLRQGHTLLKKRVQMGPQLAVMLLAILTHLLHMLGVAGCLLLPGCKQIIEFIPEAGNRDRLGLLSLGRLQVFFQAGNVLD